VGKLFDGDVIVGDDVGEKGNGRWGPMRWEGRCTKDGAGDILEFHFTCHGSFILDAVEFEEIVTGEGPVWTRGVVGHAYEGIVREVYRRRL
jgi:hypothetical protein